MDSMIDEFDVGSSRVRSEQEGFPELEFQPIDLKNDSDVCLRFREDSFILSFGSAAAFYGDDGLGGERYLKSLEERNTEIPGSCVHIWDRDRIIGQIEMRRSRDDRRTGYVNLFYLIPEYRGKGLGQLLESYASRFFGDLGCSKGRLTVSPSNIPAISFYRKHGWKDLGPHEAHPEVHLMEKRYR